MHVWRAKRANPCADEDEDHDCDIDHTVREEFFDSLDKAKRFIERIVEPEPDYYAIWGMRFPKQNKWRRWNKHGFSYGDWTVEPVSVR